jgi:uncharacterized protein involved in outer membrane biogenesis
MPAFLRSKWFLLLAGLLVVLVAALLAIPLLVDVDRYRPTIVEQMEKETGRDIEIEKLRLTFLPTLELQVANVVVKNPRGFPDGNTVGVERVDVGLAFGPLLQRQVEVTSITIQKPQLNLLSNEAGASNLDSLLQPPRRAPAGKQSEAEEAPPVTLTHIGKVAVRDAAVSSGRFWQGSKKVYPAWTITGISADVSGIDLTEPQWLKKLAAQVDLTPIEVSSPSLKEPLRFRDGLIAVKDGAADGKFEVAVGKLRAHGTVKVANLERPVADFTLRASEINTAELAGVAGGGAKGGPSGGASAKLVARGTVKVERLIVPPLAAQNLDAKVRVYGNRIEVDPFSIDLYGGRAGGALNVGLAGEAMPASLAAKVENVDVAKLVAAVGSGKKSVTGTFESDARLLVPLGAGDPLAALGGEGTFAVRDGTFPGLNLEGTLAKMAKLLQMQVPSGDTRFRSFGGDFRIVKQRIHSQKLDLDGESLEAALGGSLGFDQTLDYTGSGVLRGSGSSQPQEQQQSKSPLGGFGKVFGKVMQQTVGRMRVPFSVRGTVQNPQFILSGSPAPAR